MIENRTFNVPSPWERYRIAGSTIEGYGIIRPLLTDPKGRYTVRLIRLGNWDIAEVTKQAAKDIHISEVRRLKSLLWGPRHTAHIFLSAVESQTMGVSHNTVSIWVQVDSTTAATPTPEEWSELHDGR